MPDLVALQADLAAESDDLDEMVSAIDDADWLVPTPSPGWTVADQIGHLTWTDEVALVAAVDAVAFQDLVDDLATRFDSVVDDEARIRAAAPRATVLERWRAGRSALAEALSAVPSGAKVPWFGPPMSPASMVTARLMETWAHGQDVADALGRTRPASDRLRHVAYLGVRTRDFAYGIRGRTTPVDPFRIELTAPSGEVWNWGAADATQRVTGPALDFCLLVTQRRHRTDLGLVAEGPDADAWLDIAQAFAGPPGPGRRPGAAR